MRLCFLKLPLEKGVEVCMADSVRSTSINKINTRFRVLQIKCAAIIPTYNTISRINDCKNRSKCLYLIKLRQGKLVLKYFYLFQSYDYTKANLYLET